MMSTGEKNHHLNFHIHLPNLHFHHHHHQQQQQQAYDDDGRSMKDIPKGCLAILVGQGEEQQRFVVPVIDINHPLFMQLLKEAEEEYGFEQKGPIAIPCHVEEFRNVQGMIDREKSQSHDHHHHHHIWCFGI